jgi:peptidoglycan hydrolase-like protein with peptidoglycan-binding domain
VYTSIISWAGWAKLNEVVYEPLATMLSRFNPNQQWLVRMGFDVNTKLVRSDLTFAENIPGPVSIQNGTPKRFMPESLPTLTGIIPGTGEVSTGDRFTLFFTSSQKLTYGSRGTQVALLQELLNQIMKPVVPLSPDGNWGRKTADLVRQFQTQFGIKIDGVVGKQTRTFMQSLIQK